MTGWGRRGWAWAGLSALLAVGLLTWWPTRARTVATLWVGDLPGEGRVWLEWPRGGFPPVARVWSVGDLEPKEVPVGGAPVAISTRIRPSRPEVALRLGADRDGTVSLRRILPDGTAAAPEHWRILARVRERRLPAGWRWRGWGARMVAVVRWSEPVDSGASVPVLADRMAGEREEFLSGTRRGIWRASLDLLLRRRPGWEREVLREWQLLDCGDAVSGVLRRDRVMQDGQETSSSWKGNVATAGGLWLGVADLPRCFRGDLDWKGRLGTELTAQLKAQGAPGSHLSTPLDQRLTTLTWGDGGLVLVAASPSRSRPLSTGWWGKEDLAWAWPPSGPLASAGRKPSDGP